MPVLNILMLPARFLGPDSLMTDTEISNEVLIANRRGLHARASARFAKEAGLFDAKVNVSKDGNSVVGTSIMGLMMLGAAKGDSITIAASGVQAQQALDTLVALVSDLFGEEE